MSSTDLPPPAAGEEVKVDESLFQDLDDLDLNDEELAELSDS